MPSQVSAYRIFVGSPSGLEDERMRFREVINEYNESDALENGVLFIPIGWELTLRGMGRPQQLINDDLRRCDYCVILLHDRWGSPSSTVGPYSSGTEEEYALARQLLQTSAMLDMLIFFKAVQPSRLSDPGPQLERVLNFKRELENRKELFFDTYSEITHFEKGVRKHLAAWTRAHLKRQTRPEAERIIGENAES